ncbi:stalk domain-containing protein [Thermoanaerobacterium sp. RBIITD]|uniref:stalk domain-containing protein n=1 Tax=Thermoanaerobacterium sp. RBIITD TaxID=1550240 RepID=UPI000BB6C20A|nr:stalk domain-containing protein [Thermoanaerobacterium sp. RBIITD]SNX54231.1 NPCBM/NEW2 domain-containing protein [Thermoanaerobacterium sp. RBIITD]
MSKTKTIIIFVILLLTFGFVMGFAYAQSNSIKIVVNGNTISTDVPPLVENGRTLVPLRAISEALGVPIKWDGTTSTVYVGTVPEGIDLVDDLKPFKIGSTNTVLLKLKPVSIAGVEYNHGYSCYAEWPDVLGDLWWNLNGKYTTLTFSTGIPDNANYNKCALKIEGDGQLLKTIEMSTSDGAKQCTIDVTGVKILRIFTVCSNSMNVFKVNIPLVNPRVQ